MSLRHRASQPRGCSPRNVALRFGWACMWISIAWAIYYIVLRPIQLQTEGEEPPEYNDFPTTYKSLGLD